MDSAQASFANARTDDAADARILEPVDEWRATEDFVILSRNIAAVLARFTPFGIGTYDEPAPDDEYDIETGQIARLLLASPAEADVASVVDRVFDHYGFASTAAAVHELVQALEDEYEAFRTGR